MAQTAKAGEKNECVRVGNRQKCTDTTKNKRTGCFFGMTHYENAATKRVNQRLDYAH